MAIDYRYYFDFRSTTVGVNPIGFHALRNDVIKKTISWDQIAQMRILRGMDYNNWLIMLILGGAMAGGGLWLMAASIENIPKGEYWFASYLRFNFYSITLIGLGALVFVLGLRRTMVAEIKTKDGHWHRYSLREIAKQDKVRGLEFFIKKHLPKWVPSEYSES
jgi:hypothetical protein